MTEKRKWNVGLNSKGLEAFVTEEQAGRMVATPGATSVFIVQAHHGPYLTNEDGTIKMNLVIDLAELVPDEHVDRVLTFQRALYMARPDQYGQAVFETPAEGEVDVATAAAGIDSMVETNDDGEVTGVWDGDTTAPLPDLPETAYLADAVDLPTETDVNLGTEETGPPEEDLPQCAFPGCLLPDGHDGEHVPAPDSKTATEPEFSGA